MTVNILGTEYEVIMKKYDEDKEFESRNIIGYCNSFLKQIVICDMSTHKDCKGEEPEHIAAVLRHTKRHEITHAFFSESGLDCSSLTVDGSWATNEEMVDWIATQGPKLYEAWKSADALDPTK